MPRLSPAEAAHILSSNATMCLLSILALFSPNAKDNISSFIQHLTATMYHSISETPHALFHALCPSPLKTSYASQSSMCCSSTSCKLPTIFVQLGFFTFSFPTHVHFCISGSFPNTNEKFFSFVILNHEFTNLLAAITDLFTDATVSREPLPEFSSPHELVLRFNALLAFLQVPNMSALTSQIIFRSHIPCEANSFESTIDTSTLFNNAAVACTLFNQWNLYFFELHLMTFKFRSLSCHSSDITPILSQPTFDLFHIQTRYTQAKFDNTIKSTILSSHLEPLINNMETKLPAELIQQIRFEHFPPVFKCQCESFTNFGTASHPRHATLFPFSGNFQKPSHSHPAYEIQFILYLPTHQAISMSTASPPFASPLTEYNIFLSCAHHFCPDPSPFSSRLTPRTNRTYFALCKSALDSDRTSKLIPCNFRDHVPTYRDDPPLTIRTR